jgi:uncharacterized protein (DUF2062 family)
MNMSPGPARYKHDLLTRQAQLVVFGICVVVVAVLVVVAGHHSIAEGLAVGVGLVILMLILAAVWYWIFPKQR